MRAARVMAIAIISFTQFAESNPHPAWAEVRLNPVISSGMVLQQGRAVPIWGTAAEGEPVTVRFHGTNGVSEVATTARDGKWLVRLPALPAGGPFAMTVHGRNTIELDNILVGEVWLCSGQSNMGYPAATRPGSRELAGTQSPTLRLFTVPDKAPPPHDSEDRWLECSPNTVGNFSAVAYYFGRDLQKALKTPVGLIHASYGGSAIEHWINPAAVDADPDLASLQGRGTTSMLFNAKLANLVPYALRGVIWYQGEANTGDPLRYRTTFPALIRGWRREWGQGDFPFLFAQIAPYGKIVSEPQESDWAALREAQLLTHRNVEQTALIVTTDVGEADNIHPRRKEPVGARFALASRAVAYGEKLEYSGPLFASLKCVGSKAVLRFTHVGGGLIARDGALTGFAIAGADRRFVNARATIEGETVVVHTPHVETPVAVRYGWSDCPVVNLWNADGLPASPFRTDEFPLFPRPAEPRRTGDTPRSK